MDVLTEEDALPQTAVHAHMDLLDPSVKEVCGKADKWKILMVAFTQALI